MHRLFLIASIVIASVSCSGDVTSAKELQRSATTIDSPVLLLPDYNHLRDRGVDSRIGRIWKENGPDIRYDVGVGIGILAQSYIDQYPKMSTMRLESQTGSVLVAMDEQHDMMIVSMKHANFSVRNVRSRRDVAEVLLMLNTFPAKTK